MLGGDIVRRRTRFLVWLLVGSGIAAAVGAGVVRAPSSAPDPAAGVSRPAHSPNVLLIGIDTLRADRLGPWGGSAETPAIDRLVREGVVFRRARSVAPATGPAFASIMTSRFPPSHGVVQSAMELDRRVPTLAERLRREGYATAAFVSAYVLDARYGLDRGFDHYDDELVTRFGGALEEKDSVTLAERTESWLRSHSERPFFVWAHAFDPHSPYRCWRDDFGDGDELHGRWLVETMQQVGRREGGAARLARLHRCYQREVEHVDRLVGRLLATLDDLGVREETLVVLVADHGEALAERSGYIGHIHSLHEPVLHVPLIVRFPDGRFAGRVDERPVSSLDILPTVLEALDLPRESGVAGESLVAVLDGAPRRARPHVSMREPAHWFEEGEAFAIYEAEWKLIDYQSAPPELYHLASDPAERVNLAEQHPDRVVALQAALAAWKREVGYRKRWTTGVRRWLRRAKHATLAWIAREEPLPDVAAQDARDLDPEEVRQLRALGYLE